MSGLASESSAQRGPASESSAQRGQQPIRVMVVDDHEVVRRGLRSYFDELDDVDLVGEAGDGVAAMEQVRMLADRQQLPDVVLIDLVMRRMDGLATIRAIKQDHPSVEVLVVTSFSETQRIQSALAAGAAGYVLKDADVDEIHRAVVAARRGEVHLDPIVTRKLSRSPADAGSGFVALTLREREILVLIGRGQSNRHIAATLGVAERTVAMHVTNIFTKLHVVSRTQAALWAVREGLVQVEEE
jgi:DNA-binding NarL/FixJ family response regulator